MIKLSPRAEARSTGRLTYSTGKPCLRGHTSGRWVSTHGCVECGAAATAASRFVSPEKHAEYQAGYRAADPEKFNARDRARYRADPVKAVARVAKYRADNPEKVAAAKKEYRATEGYKEQAAKAYREWAHANPEKVAATQKAWREANPGVVRAHHAKRYVTQVQRTPAWADQEAILATYAEAVAKGLTVDHIIPLRGRKVSGLHVENNLQLLTRSENCRKHNTFEVG